MSIEVLRLRSGEDIITDVVGDADRVHGGTIEIESPAVVLPMSRDESGTVQLGLSPWIPYTEDEIITIPADWIVTRVSPKEDLASSYCQMYGKIMTPKTELIM
jgi:hypothetical protein